MNFVDRTADDIAAEARSFIEIDPGGDVGNVRSKAAQRLTDNVAFALGELIDDRVALIAGEPLNYEGEIFNLKRGFTLRFDTVRKHTGQVIGGVSPIGHPSPVPTYIDPWLRNHQEVWAAA